MTPTDFKMLMAQCRTRSELDALLCTRWHEVVGTYEQMADLREAYLARSIALDESAEPNRGDHPDCVTPVEQFA